MDVNISIKNRFLISYYFRSDIYQATVQCILFVPLVYAIPLVEGLDPWALVASNRYHFYNMFEC